MSFIWAGLLWLLSLVPILVILYVLILRRRKKFALRYSSLSLVKEAVNRRSNLRRHIPSIIFLVGIIIALTAVARPVATVLLASQQATVILTIDVSGSMRADDVKPTRLEAAKAAALAFVEKQPARVRIGVVSFSEGASLVQSPTLDREAISAAINRLTRQRRTAIGSGILTSLDAIFEGVTPEQSTTSEPTPGDVLGQTSPVPLITPAALGSYPAAIVLLSDGQSNTGPPPLEVVNNAAAAGVRIYTVGIGSPQGTVLHTEGYSIRVRLDEETLKRIAQETGGQYFRADNETDLLTIYQNLGSQLIFKPEQTELTAWFTGAALILMIIGGILSMLWFNRLA